MNIKQEEEKGKLQDLVKSFGPDYICQATAACQGSCSQLSMLAALTFQKVLSAVRKAYLQVSARKYDGMWSSCT